MDSMVCLKCKIDKKLELLKYVKGKPTSTCRACVAKYDKARRQKIKNSLKITVKEKSCIKCKTLKPIKAFSSHQYSKDGHRSTCKPCEVQSVRKYQKANPAKVNAAVKKWQTANRREVTKRNTAYRKRRCKVDLGFKLRGRLRNRIGSALRGKTKPGSAVKDLGCTVAELKTHLESLFQPGMTWDNWSMAGWHIDHIKPLCSFDLTDPTQFKQACHYTNLQPLWAKDNLAKIAEDTKQSVNR